MKKMVFFLIVLLTATNSFSQEHYYETNKQKIKNPDGTSTSEVHEIALVINEKHKSCSVRVDYKKPEMYAITSKRKDPQTRVKTYELLHKDGRKVTLSILDGKITAILHKTGRKIETHIDYSREDK